MKSLIRSKQWHNLQTIFFFTFLFFYQNGHASPISGKVVMKKGQAKAIQKNGEKENIRELNLNSDVFEGEIIETMDGSFIRLEMRDKSIISLGPLSSVLIENFKGEIGARHWLFDHLKGQLRIKVQEKAKDGESLATRSGVVALGVRGTEYLTSISNQAGKLSHDVALLEGQLQAKVGDLPEHIIKPGEHFNAEQVLKDQSWHSVKKLSADQIQNLMNAQEQFLSSGIIGAAGIVGSTLLGAAALAGGDEAAKEGGSVNSETDQQQPTGPVKIVEKIIIQEKLVQPTTPDPDDIREAKEQRQKMHKKNQCYFWFYKVLPGSGSKERFRRERACDEFEMESL